MAVIMHSFISLLNNNAYSVYKDDIMTIDVYFNWLLENKCQEADLVALNTNIMNYLEEHNQKDTKSYVKTLAKWMRLRKGCKCIQELDLEVKKLNEEWDSMMKELNDSYVAREQQIIEEINKYYDCLFEN